MTIQDTVMHALRQTACGKVCKRSGDHLSTHAFIKSYMQQSGSMCIFYCVVHLRIHAVGGGREGGQGMCAVRRSFVSGVGAGELKWLGRPS